MHNDRDVSMQGHYVTSDDILGNQGSQKIPTGTHRFGTSRHPHRKNITLELCTYVHCKREVV